MVLFVCLLRQLLWYLKVVLGVDDSCQSQAGDAIWGPSQ